MNGETHMKFTDFICNEASSIKLKAKHRESVIRELARGLLDAGQLGTDQLDGIVRLVGSRGRRKGLRRSSNCLWMRMMIRFDVASLEPMIDGTGTDYGPRLHRTCFVNIQILSVT